MPGADPPANVSRLPASAPPHRLPAQPTPLIGRERELALALSLLQRADLRLLTLTGPPGAGKTRLSLAIAEPLAESYPDGVRFIALEAVREPDHVIAAIAHSLYLREVGGQSIHELLVERLRDRTTLLILDNFEQVLPAAPALSDLLAACPELTLVVTSRAPLRIRWEHEFAVAPLELPQTPQHSAGELSEAARTATAASPAVQLFIARAQAVAPAFALTAENTSAVAAICARLDGLPLALELAAARIRLLSPAALLARLEHRLQLLTAGQRDLPERHQTLRAAIAWSYDLLSEHEQALFRRLGVFAGGFTHDAAEALLPDDAIPNRERQATMLDALTALAEQSLLRTEGDEGPRLRMLETIREFAREQLAAAGEEEESGRLHTAYFLALARTAMHHIRGPQQRAWYRRLDVEHDNIRVALEWSLHHAPRTALQLATTMVLYWSYRGFYSEGLRWLEKAMASVTTAPLRERAEALDAAGYLAVDHGDPLAARDLLEAAVSLHREVGGRYGMASSLHMLGVLARNRGDYEEAIPLFEECLSLRREIDDRTGMGQTLGALGHIWMEHSDFDRSRAYINEGLTLRLDGGDEIGALHSRYSLAATELQAGNNAAARALFEQNIATGQALGALHTITQDMHALAVLATRQGDFAEAERLLRACVERYHAGEDHRSVAQALNPLADIARLRGEYAAARALSEESLAIRREFGDRSGVALCLATLGCIHLDQGELPEARALFEEALALRRELDARFQIPLSLADLGYVRRLEGAQAEAWALLDESRALIVESGGRQGLVRTLHGLGLVALDDGDHAGAAQLFKEALPLAVAQAERLGVVSAAEGIAAVAAVRGQADHAALLLGAADTLRTTLGAPLAPALRTERAALEASLRAALGQRAYAAARDAGERLDLDALAAVAATEPEEAPARAPAAIPDSGERSAVPNPAGLTNRELEVLQLVARGLTSREIAETLVVSLSTVERHIANLYGKIGARGRADATAFAFSHGLVQPETS